MPERKRTLEPRDRILAPAAVRNEANEVVGVNLGAIVRRLVLFEEVVLESYSMRELPSLIEALGASDFIELLREGALSIRADAWVYGETGNGGLVPGYGPAPLPLLNYALSPLVPHDREHHIHLCLGEIRAMKSLGTKTSKRVRQAIVDSLVPFPPDPGRKTMDALPRELTMNEGLLRVATIEAAKEKFDRDLAEHQFDIRIEEVDEYVFRAETDLGERASLTPEVTDKVIEGALLAIASLNTRFEEMEAYNVVSGFRAAELPLVEEKFRFVLSQVDPTVQEQRFARVVEIAGLPDPETAPGSVDIERLLEIRSSEECREFRQWLRSLDQATDEEISEQVNSIREKVAQAVHSKTGKAVRIATTSGVGLIPVVGAPAAVALSALDQFALEKFVPEPGPVSFLSSSYPSIFKDSN
jgi:hypothetical protein